MATGIIPKYDKWVYIDNTAKFMDVQNSLKTGESMFVAVTASVMNNLTGLNYFCTGFASFLGSGLVDYVLKLGNNRIGVLRITNGSYTSFASVALS